MDNRHIRLTYDNGSLEIMTVSPRHEWSKRLIGRMIEAMTEELNIPIRSGGSTTFKKELVKKGLEPDECYWVANEPAVRGRADLDIEVDPPPDIAVEVGISTSVLNRLGIYAALGVSEIWRSEGRRSSSPSSRMTGLTLPWPRARVSLAALGRAGPIPEASTTMGETPWIRSFRAWVRTELAPLVPEFEDRRE